MKTLLKVHISALAAEARILRREERKWPGGHGIRRALHHQRTAIVRREARAYQLAYGFLRGRSYRLMEGDDARDRPDWEKVIRLILIYSGQDVRVLQQRFAQWLDEAALSAVVGPSAKMLEKGWGNLAP